MTTVELSLFGGGTSLVFEAHLIEGGSWTRRAVPNAFALLEHPRLGRILFDTGHNVRFLKEAARFPFFLLPWLVPAELHRSEGALEELEARGLGAGQVDMVILSHFHYDHVGGLRDFPEAVIMCSLAALESVQGLKGVAAARAGFLPSLLPPDLAGRARFVESAPWGPLPAELEPFELGWDLFEDGSAYVVPLPGHVPGHLGMFVREAGRITLLAADACFVKRSYVENVPPHRWLCFDRDEARKTVDKLHRLHVFNPAIRIVPSHCPATFES